MFWKSMRYVSGHGGKFRDFTSALRLLVKRLQCYNISTRYMLFTRYCPMHLPGLSLQYH
jgi:hypothetical protein